MILKFIINWKNLPMRKIEVFIERKVFKLLLGIIFYGLILKKFLVKFKY